MESSGIQGLERRARAVGRALVRAWQWRDKKSGREEVRESSSGETIST